jgi:hypothetical protein
VAKEAYGMGAALMQSVVDELVEALESVYNCGQCGQCKVIAYHVLTKHRARLGQGK